MIHAGPGRYLHQVPGKKGKGPALKDLLFRKGDHITMHEIKGTPGASKSLRPFPRQIPAPLGNKGRQAPYCKNGIPYRKEDCQWNGRRVFCRWTGGTCVEIVDWNEGCLLMLPVLLHHPVLTAYVPRECAGSHARGGVLKCVWG